MGIVEIATLINIGAGLIAKYKGLNVDDKLIPSKEAIGGVLTQLLSLGKLNKDDIKVDNLPATISKVESAVEGLRSLLKLPPGDQILKDVVGGLSSHSAAKSGRVERPKFVQGDADPKLILQAGSTFRFWADENSLPIVEDDRDQVRDVLHGPGAMKKNGRKGEKSTDIARIAYQDAWLVWLNHLKIRAVDSFQELLLSAADPNPALLSEEDRAPERDRANVIVETVTSLPSHYRALTDLGPPGAAGRGLVMQLNGTMKWTFSEFKGTVAHEIGHLLGLDDSDDTSRLMSGVYSGVNEPQTSDIDVARNLNWPV